jgi:hypothetical protein
MADGGSVAGEGNWGAVSRPAFTRACVMGCDDANPFGDNDLEVLGPDIS